MSSPPSPPSPPAPSTSNVDRLVKRVDDAKKQVLFQVSVLLRAQANTLLDTETGQQFDREQLMSQVKLMENVSREAITRIMDSQFAPLIQEMGGGGLVVKREQEDTSELVPLEIALQTEPNPAGRLSTSEPPVLITAQVPDSPQTQNEVAPRTLAQQNSPVAGTVDIGGQQTSIGELMRSIHSTTYPIKPELEESLLIIPSTSASNVTYFPTPSTSQGPAHVWAITKPRNDRRRIKEESTTDIDDSIEVETPQKRRKKRKRIVIPCND